MNEKITLITPTGGRPEAFKLCEKCVERQTLRPWQWIVVDDHKVTSPKTSMVMTDYFEGSLLWKPGINTQRYNLADAIPRIKGDFVFIIEDDDYYSPTYLETMMGMLRYSDIVGEGDAKYFHIGIPGYKEMKNYTHASLCQTGFKASMIPLFERAVHSGEYYIDIKMWNLALEEKMSLTVRLGSCLSVGMKGLPGRKGLGIGHTPTGFQMDSEFRQLRKWIGEDYKIYKEMALTK